MDHWQQVLRIPILDVQYEELVNDQESTSRAIVEFCGLPWDDRCLQYHKKRRVVQTSSYDQVTRPIYGSSVGRHRNFQTQLAPLKEALASAGVLTPDPDREGRDPGHPSTTRGAPRNGGAG